MKEIQVNTELPVIKMNYEEIKSSLQEHISKFSGIVVTEENLPDCKAVQKEMAKLRNTIEDIRKSIKKEMEAPIKIFDGQCKDFTSMIKEVETPIKQGIEVFNDKKREEKRNKALEYIKESIQAHNLTKKYADRLDVKDKYLNLSGSLKSIREDIEMRAVMLEKEQEDEIQRQKMLKVSIQNAIDNANEGINTKLKYEDFTKYIEFGWHLDRILKEVNDKATMIKEAEKPKEEVEEIKQVPVKEIKKDEEKYFVDIHVEHSFEGIQILSKFLKDNGYKYQVHNKGKVK